MKANPLQDKSWSSLELLLQTRQEKETTLSFAYEWTVSSYSMAASERLKTSRKTLRDTSAAHHFCVTECPDLLDKRLKVKKTKQITLKRKHDNILVNMSRCIYLRWNIKNKPNSWQRECSVVAPKAFCCSISQGPFLIPSASTFKSQEATACLWVLQANTNCLCAS